jgi:hypothetical protein
MTDGNRIAARPGPPSGEADDGKGGQTSRGSGCGDRDDRALLM